MRKVLIGSPSMYGSVDVWYVNSLIETIKYNNEHNKGIEIIPIWLSFDALIQRVRNDTLNVALELECDDIVWIDTDIEWDPKWFFKLLEYPVDVVGGTYRKKGDKEEYVYRQYNKQKPNELGLIPVDGLGTGFVRMSRKAMQYLWDVSTPYIDTKDNKERRMVFDLVIEDIDGVPSMVSEDIHAFDKLRKGGFDIFLDPQMTCNHLGHYKFQGNFNDWYKSGSPMHRLTPPAIMPRKPIRQL